jgi:predicted transcriptional regulator
MEPMEGAEQPVQNEQDFVYYTELTEKAKQLGNSTDWQLGAMEFENIRLKWGEGPQIDDEQKKALFAEVQEAQKTFDEARRAWYERQNERKAANLEKREGLIKRLSDLIDQKKWSQFNEVAALQRKFEDVRPLPPAAEAQNVRFQTLLDTFNKHKVDYLVKMREKEEENLMIKLTILDKIKGVVETAGPETTDWKQLDEQIEALSQQWRKVGRVVKEKSDEIWQQYKDTRDSYQARKMEFNKEYKAELEKNIKLREQLIAGAEELLKLEDLALASKDMNILHRRWKEAGPVPKEKSDELWDKFKVLFDKFNEVRNENIDEIRAKEQENLELKEALCEKAESLLNDESGVNRKDLIETLYQEWNVIGPVPKRRTRKLWKRFKDAIDGIQKKRRDHFKDLRNEQKDNLRRKREITERIIVLSEQDDKEEALVDVKALQQEFMAIGFVPIKLKNKIWDEYRAACDVFFKALRSSGRQAGSSDHAPRGQVRTSQSAPAGIHGEIKHRQNEIFRLRKESDKLNEIILQYSDTKTYIKPNKKGLQLRDELQAKIDKAQSDLDKKNSEIESLKREIDELGKTSEE